MKERIMSDLISRQAAIELASGGCHPANVARELANLPSAQPEVGTQMSPADCISRQAAIDAVRDNPDDLIFQLMAIEDLPSSEPEWNNHTVASLLAELFDDTCACNYNDIGEWLPEKCELLDSCPNPVGVACWEQFLKHKAERKEE